MGNKKITYLLGAGASCQAIPTYNSFKSHFLNFISHTADYFEKNPDYGKFGTQNSLIINSMRNLVERILDANSATIDVYAKSIYLRNGSRNEHTLLKILLNYYIIAEQIKNENKFRLENFKFSAATHDQRYDPFLQTILNSGVIKPNINIISWNYDNQLEMSYSRIYGAEFQKSQIKLQLFPSPTTNIAPKCGAVIKLNGTAGAHSQESFDYITVDPTKEILNNDFFDRIFYAIKTLVNHIAVVTDLKFAWELNDNGNNIAVNHAKRILRETDILVVIGYSFPDANREIDSEIFSEATDIEKIWVQVHKDDFDVVTAEIRDLEISFADKIEFHPAWDRKFYVPPDK